MSLLDDSAPEFTLDSTAGESVSLSENLDDGPAVVLINRGHWCSFCAEQLASFSRVSEDLRFNEDVTVLPVVTDPLPKLQEMRDRFDYRFQLLADPEGEVADQYSGTEQTSHGLTGIAGPTSSTPTAPSATNRSPTTPPTAPTGTGSATSSATTTKIRSGSRDRKIPRETATRA